MSLPKFGVEKPVPVNLLMMAIILTGLVSGLSLRREFFPEIDPEAVSIATPYPGAVPEEVEESLVIKIEDRLTTIESVDEISASVFEGGAGITANLVEGSDVDEALEEIEREMDSLLDLPEDSEEIVVEVFEARLPVIMVTVAGELDEASLKDAIRGVREDLRDMPGMGELLIEGARDYEVRVDLRQSALLQYGLSLPEVTQTIQSWMREVPGGTVRGSLGDTRVRTMGVTERDETILQIPVLTQPDGTVVRVADIGTVTEGFVDEALGVRFNQQPAARITVFKVGDQDIVEMAERVRAYVLGRQGEPLGLGWFERLTKKHMVDAYEIGLNSTQANPQGLQIATMSDLSRFVEGRLDLLVRNARNGAVLVFITLLLFLNWRAAMWVGVGLTTALLGTLVLMGWLDVTLNLLTMFGLIVVLGLLVDDAIVVAENIQARHERGEPALSAAVRGAGQVSWPVVATVMTSVVAFLPLSFIKGQIGDLLGALPMVVAVALFMSLLESLLILPSHMGHSLLKRDQRKTGKLASMYKRFEDARDRLILHTVVPRFGVVLGFLLKNRYTTVAVALAILIGSMGLVAGKRVVFEFLPDSDAETLIVDVQMPVGTNLERTNAAVATIESAIAELQADGEVKLMSAQVGQSTNIDTGEASAASPHIAQIFIELAFVEDRDRESSEIIADLRSRLEGRLPEVERISFSQISGGPAGPDIQMNLASEDDAQRQAAVNDLKRLLANYNGVVDIRDNAELGQPEMQWSVTESGAALGFTNQFLATQLRGFLFGLDAHVFSEREEDIDVRVRLDEDTRRSLFDIENAWVMSPSGIPVPLIEVAEVEETQSYAMIRRIDRERAVTVMADIVPGISPEEIVEQFNKPNLGGGDNLLSKLVRLYRMLGLLEDPLSPLDELRAKYPMVSIEYAGRQEQTADAFASLPIGFAASAVLIYVILAWLFSSYFQPLAVMSAIPFAMIGMVWGHFLLGYNMTFLSLIGFVALSGIVVNDSLILVEFYNDERRLKGMSVYDSLVSAGRSRLRAIMLTTITTVLGLTPLILEQSFQAKFLIPMGISIAGGLVSATGVILIVLPCLMLIFDDVGRLSYFLWHGHPKPEPKPIELDIQDT